MIRYWKYFCIAKPVIILNLQVTQRGSLDGVKLWDGYPEVMGSSSLGGIGGFTRLVTPKPCGISRGARKLARTSTIKKKKKN